MVKEIPVRDDFEPLFFDEMGRLVVVVGRLEYELKLFVKQLLGKGFKAGMLEAEKMRNFSRLCDEVVDLAKQTREKKNLTDVHVSRLEALIKKIKLRAELRNDVVHALWTTTDSRNPLRIRPELLGKKGSQSVNWSKGRVVPLGELQQLRRRLEKAYDALQCQRKIWK